MKSLKNQIEKLLFVLLVIFLINSCSTKVENNDLIKKGLKGKVKSVSIEYFQAKENFGEVKEGGKYLVVNIEKFDRNGNIIEDLSDNFTEIYEYEDKKLSESTTTSKYNGIFKSIYKYDNDNNLIEKAKNKRDGSLLSKIIYKYDNNNNLIEETNYKKDGSLNSKIIYKYDDYNNLIEETNYKKDGSKSKYSTYKYDDNNLIEETISYKEGSVGIYKTYEYDDDNNLIEKVEDFSDFTNITINNYEFDENMNWIKNTQYIDNIPRFVFYRDIKYY